MDEERPRKESVRISALLISKARAYALERNRTFSQVVIESLRFLMEIPQGIWGRGGRAEGERKWTSFSVPADSFRFVDSLKKQKRGYSFNKTVEFALEFALSGWRARTRGPVEDPPEYQCTICFEKSPFFREKCSLCGAPVIQLENKEQRISQSKMEKLIAHLRDRSVPPPDIRDVDAHVIKGFLLKVVKEAQRKVTLESYLRSESGRRLLETLEGFGGKRLVEELGGYTTELRGDWFEALLFFLERLYRHNDKDLGSMKYFALTRKGLMDFFGEDKSGQKENFKLIWKNGWIAESGYSLKVKKDGNRILGAILKAHSETGVHPEELELVFNTLRYCNGVPSSNIVDHSIREIRAGRVAGLCDELGAIGSVKAGTAKLFLLDLALALNLNLPLHQYVVFSPTREWLEVLAAHLEKKGTLSPDDDTVLSSLKIIKREGVDPKRVDTGYSCIGEELFGKIIRISN